jgi:hypothetical protein
MNAGRRGGLKGLRLAMDKNRTSRFGEGRARRKFRPFGAALLLSSCVLAVALGCFAADASRSNDDSPRADLNMRQASQNLSAGHWVAERTPSADVLSIRLQVHPKGGGGMASFSLPLHKLEGLTQADISQGAAPVRFRLVRDAGTFTCEGTFKNGKGAGNWTFTPDAAFAAAVPPAYRNLSQGELLSLALADVGPSYLRELREVGYADLSVEQLAAMRTNAISAEYIRGLKSVGYAGLPPEDLVALRSNGVTVEVIRAYRGLLEDEIPATQYIALLSNGVTASYVDSLRSVGYKSLTASEAIGLRVHGVTKDFVEKANARGQKNLSVEQLIEMRVRGVGP